MDVIVNKVAINELPEKVEIGDKHHRHKNLPKLQFVFLGNFRYPFVFLLHFFESFFLLDDSSMATCVS